MLKINDHLHIFCIIGMANSAVHFDMETINYIKQQPNLGREHNSEDKCFEAGTYVGNDIDYVKDLPDAESCQKECQKIPECKFWTYNPNTWNGKNKCFRQTANANETLGTCKKGTCIRGPRDCPVDCATVSNGEFGFCSCNPCSENEGNCDSDHECQDGHFCGYKNCPVSLGFDTDINCCVPIIPPFFEADYLEIVKDLPEISLGPSSGYNYTRKLSVHGPDAFPVVTDNDGYAYIVAGKFGKGKFMVFPWVEKYLEQLHSSQKKLLDNTYQWMIKDNTLRAATNIENLDASLATFIVPETNVMYHLTGNCFETGNYKGNDIDCVLDLPDAESCQKACLKLPKCIFWTYNPKSWDGKKRCYRQTANANETLGTNSKSIRGPRLCPGDLIEEFNYQNFNLFFAGDYASWSEESVQKLKDYISNGGNVIFGSADDWRVGNREKRDPMRNFQFLLGVFDEVVYDNLSEDKTFNLEEIPSKENILSEVLKGAINGILPEKIDWESLATKRLYNFYNSFAFEQPWNNFYWKNLLAFIDAGTEFVKTPIYDIMEKAYLGILDNYDIRDEHYPDYVSFFQNQFLPSVLQTDYNSKLIRKLPASFPPDVNPEEVKFVTKTIKVDWKYEKPEGCNIEFKTNMISTKLYAVPGKLFTISIPEEQVGKVKLRINAHKDNAISNNKKRLESGKSAKRPGLISMEYTALNSSMQLMSPYGGTIYVFLESDASFDMTINGAIEMPYFIQGKTTNDEFNEMVSSLKSPMMELEIPGSIIFTLPITTVNEEINDLTVFADTWKEIMDNFQSMVDYKLPRPMRYVTDVEISHGGAHAGYPIMDALPNSLGQERLERGDAWGCLHEIGHNFQEPRWTPKGTGEVTNNIFAIMINNKMFGKNYSHSHFEERVIDFGYTDRTLEDLRSDVWIFLASYIGPHLEFGWEPYANTFKEYLKMENLLDPDTDEQKHSTWAKLMSLHTEYNLVPYFQWWGWPINVETINATQHLPIWDMAYKMDEIFAKGRKCDGSIPNCCTESDQCDFGDGHCDSDDQCLGTLICGTKNCVGNNFDPDQGCCTEPNMDI